MSDRLQSFGFVRGIDESNRRVTVIASTGDIARDDAIIEPRGWDLSYYERNPVVLWAHRDDELPIARTVESQVTDHELIQTHEFLTHARAEEVWQAVREGGVNATSVRWQPGETEVRKVVTPTGSRNVLVFTRGHQLLETSYVPIPADPGAVVLRTDGKRLQWREESGRMVIDYSMRCGCKGCPNDGWAGTVDVCRFHLDMLTSGDCAMPCGCCCHQCDCCPEGATNPECQCCCHPCDCCAMAEAAPGGGELGGEHEGEHSLRAITTPTEAAASIRQLTQLLKGGA